MVYGNTPSFTKSLDQRLSNYDLYQRTSFQVDSWVSFVLFLMSAACSIMITMPHALDLERFKSSNANLTLITYVHWKVL